MDETKETSAETKEDSIKEILESPLTEEEARKLAANVDVQLAQLGALRVQKTLELGQIDYQIEAARFDKAVIYRRVLNTPETEEK